MIFLRSLVLNVLFIAWTAVMAIVAMISIPFPLGWAFKVPVIWGHGTIKYLGRIAGIELEARGRENLPEGPVLVASKHQSAWDTAVFFCLLHRPSVVLKKELLMVPLFGPYCRKTGLIPIDRLGQAPSLRGLLKRARRIVDEGRPILIFPEGTRVNPGERKPYLAGVAGLYRNLGVPVVPVALNSGMYWPRRKFMRRPGQIVVEFLEPIPPGLGRKEFMERLQMAIESKTDELVEEVRHARAAVDNSRGPSL